MFFIPQTPPPQPPTQYTQTQVPVEILLDHECWYYNLNLRKCIRPKIKTVQVNRSTMRTVNGNRRVTPARSIINLRNADIG